MNLSIDNISAVLFDLDGTVYYGSKIIPGANAAISYFRNNGKSIFFTTNNSTRTRKQIYEKLLSIGVDCKYDEVITSGYLAAVYAKSMDMKNIYIFGSENLIEEFENLGVKVSSEETAENLLIGYNPEMTYEGLTGALQVALHAKQIIACNKERVFPGENRRPMPGCGAMTAPIEWCTHRDCDLVIGKPNTFIVDYLIDNYKHKRDRILVIGDTYETDIAMANRAGCRSILISKQVIPDEITVDSIGHIPALFEKQGRTFAH